MTPESEGVAAGVGPPAGAGSGADSGGRAGLRVLAVDDEPPALGELTYLLEQADGVGAVTPVGSAAEALAALQADEFDAVFLDIRMPGIDGLALAGILARFATAPAVVFVTAYDNHAVDAFDVAAVDYLLKPIRAERLALAVDRVRVRLDTQAGPSGQPGPEPHGAGAPGDDAGAGSASADETIAVELGGVTRYLKRSEVVYVEAQRDYVRLRTRSSGHLVRVPLATLEQRWASAGFLRVHRRYLVNGAYVQELRGSRRAGLGGARRRAVGAGQPPVHPGRALGPGGPPSHRPRPSTGPRRPGRGPAMTSGQRPRREVISAPRRTVRRRSPRSAAQDIDQQTRVGAVYLQALIRSQLRLGLATVAVVVVPLAALPLIFALAPGVRGLQVGPLPLWWLLLGVLVYPAILARGLAVRPRRRAHRGAVHRTGGGSMSNAAIILGITGTVVATITLSALSSRLARTTGDFYVASRSVPAWWNASAISGEYLSAASFLGVAGLILAGGADAVWFPVGYAVGYVLLLALVAAPLRRSGAYTLPDFCEARLHSRTVRLAASLLVVVIGWLYVVPQLQGAGLALQTVLGTPVWLGGVLVAVVVLVVIVGGGMRSVTMVQGFQYWLKLVAVLLPVLFVLAAWRLDGAPSALVDQTPTVRSDTTVTAWTPVRVTVIEPIVVVADGAIDGAPVAGEVDLPAGEHQIGAGTTLTLPAGATVPHVVGTAASTGTDWGQPLRGAQSHPMYRTYALMIALFLGTMGLPHVLVRFYTNPDGRQARRTALIVIGLVGLFYLAPPALGMLGRLYTPQLLMTGNTDAVVLLLPGAMISGGVGQLLTAVVCAGAAAAFLATATGLTVTVAGVLSQDVVSRVVPDPIRSFRVAAVLAVLAPLGLSLLAEALPLAQAVALAFTVAACTFCPLLLLGIWWPRLTDAGAATGLAVGGALAVGAITAATTLDLTGWPDALLAQPAAWAMPLALLTMVVVSRATADRLHPGVARIMIRLHTPEAARLQPAWTARGDR